MLPDIGASELLVIAIVALIVVGPKDLPVLLRKLGQFMAKVRSMAAEFRASFDEMARQSELDELRKEVEAMRAGQFADIASHAGEATTTFDEINQGLSDVGVDLHRPMGSEYGVADEVAEVPTAVKPPRKARAPATAAKRAAPKVTTAKAAAPRAVASKAPPKRAAPAASAKPKPAPRKPSGKAGA